MSANRNKAWFGFCVIVGLFVAWIILPYISSYSNSDSKRLNVLARQNATAINVINQLTAVQDDFISCPNTSGQAGRPEYLYVAVYHIANPVTCQYQPDWFASAIPQLYGVKKPLVPNLGLSLNKAVMDMARRRVNNLTGTDQAAWQKVIDADCLGKATQPKPKNAGKDNPPPTADLGTYNKCINNALYIGYNQKLTTYGKWDPRSYNFQTWLLALVIGGLAAGAVWGFEAFYTGRDPKSTHEE